MKESSEHWINENKKLKYAFDLFVDSTKDKQASMTSELIKANKINLKLRQQAKVGWFTVVVLMVIVGCML